MLDIGKVISWMNLVSILGRMEEFMKDSTKKTENTDGEFIDGLMAKSMQDGGIMENNMAQEYLQLRMARENLVYGKKAKRIAGLAKKKPKTLSKAQQN